MARVNDIMKFLVISDIHANDAAIDWVNDRIVQFDVDAVMVLGDVTHFGPVQWALDFLVALKAPAYVIPGNCDPLDLPPAISAVAIDMHGKSKKMPGFTLVGLGGSNPTIFNTPFELSEKEIDQKLSVISSSEMILMVHTPPYGVHDEIPSGINVGSTALAKIIRKFKPRAVLSGHIHEARGLIEMDGTLFMNPGPAKDGYAALLEIGAETVKGELLDPLPN